MHPAKVNFFPNAMVYAGCVRGCMLAHQKGGVEVVEVRMGDRLRSIKL